MSLRCDYFESGRCGSCVDIRLPYPEQLARKALAVQVELGDWPGLRWLPPVASPPAGFRGKAKMAVSGSVDAPQLGLADAAGHDVDLSDCLLYPPALAVAFAPIKDFIRAARIPPYDIRGRRGELKFVLLSLAEHSGELMLRLVLRSREALPRIERTLPALRAALPQLRVISANLQPLPAAVLEGPVEIPLSAEQHLRLQVNGRGLWLRPRSFFQTNPAIAAALYRQAERWVEACSPDRVWDLFCGVGGFALHCANGRREVRGVEVSEEAVEAAQRAARERGDPYLQFEVRDAGSMHLPAAGGPDLLIVNPPRRGIGEALCEAIQARPPGWLIYSSCNARTLAADLRRMHCMQPIEAQVLDMFPHTPHAESLVLLRHRDRSSQ